MTIAADGQPIPVDCTETSLPSQVQFRCVLCGIIFDTRSDIPTRRAYII